MDVDAWMNVTVTIVRGSACQFESNVAHAPPSSGETVPTKECPRPLIAGIAEEVQLQHLPVVQIPHLLVLAEWILLLVELVHHSLNLTFKGHHLRREEAA